VSDNGFICKSQKCTPASTSLSLSFHNGLPSPALPSITDFFHRPIQPTIFGATAAYIKHFVKRHIPTTALSLMKSPTLDIPLSSATHHLPPAPTCRLRHPPVDYGTHSHPVAQHLPHQNHHLPPMPTIHLHCPPFASGTHDSRLPLTIRLLCPPFASTTYHWPGAHHLTPAPAIQLRCLPLDSANHH